MNKFVLVVLGIASLIAVINAHAEMIQPPNRGAAWRFFPDQGFGENEYNSEWCANVEDLDSRVFTESNSRKATCGIAGPIYDGKPDVITKVVKGGPGITAYIPSFEVQSPIYTGMSVANYTKGALIDVTILILAGHQGGPHSFHICPASYKHDPTQECLDNNPLPFEDGRLEGDLNDSVSFRGELPPTNKKRQMKAFKVKLPVDLVCEHCVLQWKWIGKKTKQVYYSAADVTIV